MSRPPTLPIPIARVLVGAMFVVAASACRHRAPTPSPAPSPAVRRAAATPAPQAPALFADANITDLRVVRPLESRRLLGPSFTAVDNAMAALAPNGTLHWIDLDANGAPQTHETETPCRFDPSMHSITLTLSPRIALDGNGFACCVHDGGDANPTGAYCADLRATPVRWTRAHTPGAPSGVGSGAGAIAMFHSDLWCTTDGGAHLSVTFRGDESQLVSVASCDRTGRAVAVAGTRSLTGYRDQTIRFAPAGGALVMVPDAPRGEPRDARLLDDGSFAVIIENNAPRLAMRSASGTVRTEQLLLPPSLALGVWGTHTVLTRSGRNLRAFDLETGTSRDRTVDLNGPGVVCAARLGHELAAFGHDGAASIFATE
jgi:hypothetical protein